MHASTQFSDHLLSLDPEEELLEAFACFDDGDTGYVSVKVMREFLSNMGDRMSEEDVSRGIAPRRWDGLVKLKSLYRLRAQISRFLSPPFADKHGMFAYRDFLKVLRITDLDQQEKAKAAAAASGAPTQ